MMALATLKELGITAMGEALSILKQAKEPSTQTIYSKAPQCKLRPTPTPIPSATTGPITPTSNDPLLHPYTPTSSTNGTYTAIEPSKQATYTSPHHL